MSVKIFSSLPKFLVDSVQDENQYKGKLKEIIICNSFYSVSKFFNCEDLWLKDMENRIRQYVPYTC
jgi:hypothetical protein